MTRSGQCYASINSGTREGESFAKNEGTKIATPKKKDKEPKMSLSPRKKQMNS